MSSTLFLAMLNRLILRSSSVDLPLRDTPHAHATRYRVVSASKYIHTRMCKSDREVRWRCLVFVGGTTRQGTARGTGWIPGRSSLKCRMRCSASGRRGGAEACAVLGRQSQQCLATLRVFLHMHTRGSFALHFGGGTARKQRRICGWPGGLLWPMARAPGRARGKYGQRSYNQTKPLPA